MSRAVSRRAVLALPAALACGRAPSSQPRADPAGPRTDARHARDAFLAACADVEPVLVRHGRLHLAALERGVVDRAAVRTVLRDELHALDRVARLGVELSATAASDETRRATQLAARAAEILRVECDPSVTEPVLDLMQRRYGFEARERDPRRFTLARRQADDRIEHHQSTLRAVLAATRSRVRTARSRGFEYLSRVREARGVAGVTRPDRLAQWERETRGPFVTRLPTDEPWWRDASAFDRESRVRSRFRLPFLEEPWDRTWPRVLRWLEGVGLGVPNVTRHPDVGADGYPHCVALRIPTEIHVFIRDPHLAVAAEDLAHEIGHAVGAAHVDVANPVMKGYHRCVGLADDGLNEGLAEFFSRVVSDPEVVGQIAPELEPEDRRWWGRARLRNDVNARRVLGFECEFETAAFADPDGDLDGVERELLRRWFAIERTSTAPPTWATGLHFEEYPGYMGAYLHGEHIALAIREALETQFGSHWCERTALRRLRDALIAPGESVDARVRWRALTGRDRG